MTAIIAAVATNRAIGRAGQLIYRLPDDMRRFKALTTGNTVVMGRRTFESLPKGALPNRRNIVVSRTCRQFDGCERCGSLQEALALCGDGDDVFIIGGAMLYEEALTMADRLLLTEIDATPADADVFFPEYRSGWHEVRREEHPADARHAVPFAFVDYVRDTDRP